MAMGRTFLFFWAIFYSSLPSYYGQTDLPVSSSSLPPEPSTSADTPRSSSDFSTTDPQTSETQDAYMTETFSPTDETDSTDNTIASETTSMTENTSNTESSSTTSPADYQHTNEMSEMSTEMMSSADPPVTESTPLSTTTILEQTTPTSDLITQDLSELTSSPQGTLVSTSSQTQDTSSRQVLETTHPPPRTTHKSQITNKTSLYPFFMSPSFLTTTRNKTLNINSTNTNLTTPLASTQKASTTGISTHIQTGLNNLDSKTTENNNNISKMATGLTNSPLASNTTSVENIQKSVESESSTIVFFLNAPNVPVFKTITFSHPLIHQATIITKENHD